VNHCLALFAPAKIALASSTVLGSVWLPGDSLFAPRRVPHVWAHVGEGRGSILVAFTPAGKM
jgi:hypothetical protein